MPARSKLWYGVPVAAFVLAELINTRMLQHHMLVDACRIYQLLDEGALTTRLFDSLLLLHAQPPLLNALAGLVFKTAESLLLTPATVANVVFGASGLATTLLLFHLSLRWTASPLLACIAVLCYLAEPSYYVQSTVGTGRNFFFYEFLLQPLLLIAVASAAACAERIRWASGLRLVLASAAVVYLRALFHPFVWAGVVIGLALLPHSRAQPKRVIALVTLGLTLLVAWPLKNYVLFDAWTWSSWDGYNLSRAFGVMPYGLRRFQARPSDATPLLLHYPALASWSPESLSVVTAAGKGCGGPNWNNLGMLRVRREGLERGFAAMRDPQTLLPHVARMYKHTTQPMYIHPYTLDAFGKKPEQFTGYLWLYDRLFYSRLGGRERIAWTLFGVFYLPLVLLCSVRLIARDERARVRSIVLSYTAFFPIVVACLSDGVEGNRMRHSTYPLLILIGVMALGSWVRERARPSDQAVT